ncbi:uncharacterized protein LOC129051867 [Pongo abelii]|uniref:uncharacterized protein LOC129051867 n=1 Tax=Pongo abelii TaxID=9601 RepID=UPI00300626A2
MARILVHLGCKKTGLFCTRVEEAAPALLSASHHPHSKALGARPPILNAVRNRKRKCEPVRRYTYSPLSSSFLAGFSPQPSAHAQPRQGGAGGPSGRRGEGRRATPRTSARSETLRPPAAAPEKRRLLPASTPRRGVPPSPLSASSRCARIRVGLAQGPRWRRVFFSNHRAPLFKSSQSTFVSFLQKEKHLSCCGKGPQRPLVTDRAIAVRSGRFFQDTFCLHERKIEEARLVAGLLMDY